MMKGLPVSCFPPLAATERLAEKKAKAVKGNSLCKTPFPFVEVADFQPAWSAEQVCMCLVVGALAPQHMIVCQFVFQAQAFVFNFGEKLEETKTKRLDFVRWLASFQCYALAAEVTGVCWNCIQLFCPKHVRFNLSGLEVPCGMRTPSCVYADCRHVIAVCWCLHQCYFCFAQALLHLRNAATYWHNFTTSCAERIGLKGQPGVTSTLTSTWLA